MNRLNNTRITEELIQRLEELFESLKGWNLISNLYSEPSCHEEDLVHALAVQARAVVLQSICITLKIALSGLSRRSELYYKQLGQLDVLTKREKKLCAMCKLAFSNVEESIGKETAA